MPGAGAKQGDTVELFRGDRGQLALQGEELRIIIGFVACALGDVIIKGAQFADTGQYITGHLKCTVLSLQERYSVTDVIINCALAFGRGTEFHRDSETAGVIRGVDDFRAAGEPVQALL